MLVAILIEALRVFTSGSRLRLTVAGLAVLILILLLIAVPYGARARIVVAGESVLCRGWRSRRFTRRDVAEVVACRTGFNGNNRVLLLKGNGGQCLLSLYADYWSDTDLQSLLLRLGQPVPDNYDAACSAAMLRRHCSGGGLPLVMARPGAVALLLSPVIIAVIVLVVQLFSQ